MSYTPVSEIENLFFSLKLVKNKGPLTAKIPFKHTVSYHIFPPTTKGRGFLRNNTIITQNLFT